MKVKWHRQIPAEATVCTVQVKRQGSRWYAYFSLRDVPRKPLSASGQSVGVDLGISTFAALSTGELISGPRANRAGAKAVRRAQRKVARSKRGSARRRKAVLLLARQREREANRRRDHAHKTARDLINRFDVIAVENLNVRGLSRGMLARDCSDQGWAAFAALLDEKAEDAARQVVRVDPRNTSRTCPACGTVKVKKLSERTHSCDCGLTLDRDVAAAKVILLRATGPDGAVRRQQWSEEARAVA